MDAEQLTTTEAVQLRRMLDRTSLTTLLGALAVLCEQNRELQVEHDAENASRWAAASLVLSRAETDTRRINP